MRKPLMAGNWKMYKTPDEARAYLDAFVPLVRESGHAEIVICPPFPALEAAVASTRGTNIHVGGQNLYWERDGAFTGEVCGPMLRAVGCSHVIVGHSERRQYFGDTDANVARKAVAALDAGLIPIVCIGEKLDDREAGRTESVLMTQIAGALAAMSDSQFAAILIAYEPVWAIGTGKTATPQMAADAHAIIRRECHELFGVSAATQLRILYGGSVKPDNTAALMSQHDIDGVLVGGASLDPKSFAAIVNY
jgi:triosephosphate isomerase (TIM)